MWLVRFDNFGSVFRLNPPRVSQKSLGLPGRWLPANPLPLTRHGNLKRGKASAGARSIRRMGVWVEVISCCPHAGNACLAVAPMITGCLNLNPAGRAIGRMWRGSRGVVAEGRGEGKRWVTVKHPVLQKGEDPDGQCPTLNSGYWLASAVQTREALSLLLSL